MTLFIRKVSNCKDAYSKKRPFFDKNDCFFIKNRLNHDYCIFMTKK